MTNLANARVIVTGGSAGLGLAMVGALVSSIHDFLYARYAMEGITVLVLDTP
jgi:NAD(P)-dependent dehydrogenase (short-subunit alcohol dehydrogenase family)